MAGGAYESIGKQVGKSAATIRVHAKYRIKSGKWRLDEKDDKIKMIAV